LQVISGKRWVMMCSVSQRTASHAIRVTHSRPAS
jgi:hypothetical protein